jgi:GNAT superfamily N-acetyltransferase
MLDEASPSAAVNTVPADKRERVVATIMLAFSTDPMSRWSLPDPAVFLAHFPDLVRAFAGSAFDDGTVYETADYSGAAVWLGPGRESDLARLIEVLQKAMSPDRFEQGGSLFEQMDAFHPREPHWYLPLIGVDPASQGRGYGARLMDHALRECDRTGLPAYLESSNPANVPFYATFGFKVMGEIQSGTSPVMYPMLRPRAK